MSNTPDEDQDTSVLESISSGAIIFLIAYAISNILGLLINIVLTRTLGPGLYGVFSYSKNIMSLSRIFTILGADIGLLRFIPSKETDDDREEVLGLTVVTISIGCFIFCILLYIFSPLISGYTLKSDIFVGVLRLFALILSFETFIKVISSVFRSLELPKYQMLIEKVLYSFIRLLSISVAAYLGYSVFGITIAIAIGLGLLVVFGFLLLITTTGLSPQIPRKSREYREYYEYTLPTIFSQLGTLMYRKVDILIVGFFLSASAVGIYNIALLLAQIILLPVTGFNQLFPSIASKLYSNDNMRELDQTYSIITRWAFTLSLPIFIFIYLFRENILWLFGESFVAGSTVLSIVILGQLANVLAGPSNYLLLMTDHHHFVAITKIISGIGNILLNIYLISQLGLIGAAVATAVIISLFNFIQIIAIIHFEGFNPYSGKYLKPVFVGFAMGSVLYFVSINLEGIVALLVGFITGSLIFVTLSFVLGIEKQDKEFLRSYLSL